MNFSDHNMIKGEGEGGGNNIKLTCLKTKNHTYQ